MKKAIRTLVSRFRATITRDNGNRDADLQAEMESHLQMHIDENIRRGMTSAEARRHAMIAAGGFVQATERHREQRRLPYMESIAADTRFAVRQFRRAPLSTVTIILVLSLGIGTNVVLFTILNSVTSLPAPGIARDPSVVRIRGTTEVNATSPLQPRLLSWPESKEYASHKDVFASVAAYATEHANVMVGDASTTPSFARVVYTTPDYYNVLRIRPTIGSLPPADANPMRASTPPAAMISYAMWKDRFGGAEDVAGKTIRVNNVAVEITGVAPARFNGTEQGSGMTVWLPLSAYPAVQSRDNGIFLSEDSAFLQVAARLRSAYALSSARQIVASIAKRRHANADVAPMLAGNDRAGGNADDMMNAAAGGGFGLLILLITCTNVSALLVGLAVARRREIGVRLSLGAPRGRLIRQLLTESVLLSMIAACVGLLVTAAGIRVVSAVLRDVQLIVDTRVVIATFAVAMVTGVLFGLSPALHATRVPVGDVLRGSANAVAGARSRLQRALVVAQITLTQPLLLGLGVLIVTTSAGMRSARASHNDAQLAEIEVDAWDARLPDDAREAQIDAMVRRIAAMPGVVRAVPMQFGSITSAIAVHPADRVTDVAYNNPMVAQMIAAPAGYFDAMGIPIMRGRDFDEREHVRTSNDPGKPLDVRAVIIGSDVARRLWGGSNPIGRRLTVGQSARPDSGAMTVVGVVDEKVAGRGIVNGQLRVYVPYSPINTGVIVRTEGAALPMMATLRRAAAAEVPRMPVTRAETVEQRVTREQRDLMRTVGIVAGAGVLALLLSAIGLYAVVSFAVGQRTKEIGIRTALGARQGQVVLMFFRNGLVLSAIGLALGLPLSMLVTRLIAMKLSVPVSGSPLIGVAIGAVVLLVASIAAWVPARRASMVSPTIAIRAES